MKKEPSLITGALLALLAGLTTLLGAGGLEDGFQVNPDLWIILGPVAAALGIRFNPNVWSQETVDLAAKKEDQRRALRHRAR